MLLLIGFILTTFSATSNWTQEKAEIEARPTQMLSPSVNKKVQRAMKLSGSNDFRLANDILQSLKKHLNKRPASMASVLLIQANVKVQMDQTEQATQTLKQALELKALPMPQTLTAMMMLAQLELAEENHSSALTLLRKWDFFSSQPNAKSHMLQARAHFGLNQLEQAKVQLEQAANISGELSEAWRSFAVSLLLQLKDYPKAIDHLEKLVRLNPSKSTYWKQLTSVYVQVDQNEKATIAMALAERMGHLNSESDILNLATLYLAEDAPLLAAELLESKLEKKVINPTERTYSILANAWLMSRNHDQAHDSYLKAANLATHGKHNAQLGQLLLLDENWKSAENQFQEALRKGSLTNTARAHLGLAIALIRQDNFAPAKKHLNFAKKDKTTAKIAQEWERNH